MSERTTIGGTVYESIGSSSSSLLLKCNGTARIQWGGKLIDLIKNGKIASADNSTPIFIISNESEIKSEGIYILNSDKFPKLLIYKDGDLYNLNETDLYISANNKQDITVEQKKQALENIGIYYNTYTELESSDIQNGIAYVLENGNLYTIKNGIISDFEATLKTVTVETSKNQEGVINSSFKIVLSILDDEYLILQDKRITVNYPIYVKNSAQIGSEDADETKGYRLYINGDTSYLDVDKINVRDGINIKDYSEITFDDLVLLVNSESLEPHNWYLINNFQNHWKLDVSNSNFNRPILLRALTNSTFYKEGFLFEDRQVIINYDHTFQEQITQTIIGDDGTTTTQDVRARGRITWMVDGNNNKANFDFLDYTNSKEEPLTTLHEYGSNKSIFPQNSHNNTLIVYDLKGTVLKNKIIDDSNTNIVDFQMNDSSGVMCDNYIECRGLIIYPSCKNFYGNTLNKVCKLGIYNDFINNTLKSVYTTSNLENNISFDSVENNAIFSDTQINHLFENVSMNKLINSSINASITNSTFIDVVNCVFNCEFNKVQFKSLTDCTFNSGKLVNIIVYSNITNYTFSDGDNSLLYDVNKFKKVYFKNSILQVICEYEHFFRRGMIMMYSGIEEIPEGWAICDGNSYTFNGITSQTPNLINKFIKAVSSVEDVKEFINPDLNGDNELTLKLEHLPEHKHSHVHDFSGTGSGTFSDSFEALTSYSPEYAITSVTGGTSGYSGDNTSSSRITVSDTVSMDISGTTTEEINTENSDYWTNKAIKIEPNSYSLIFIMKL